MSEARASYFTSKQYRLLAVFGTRHETLAHVFDSKLYTNVPFVYSSVVVS